ncbi:ATP-binding protein [Nocardioides gansuensis]|nr:LuxR C-terminal-related transcriptional regulator [Nocardioides gansuensis]
MASATLTRRRDNLPFEVTSFVGRRRELADLRRLLTTARLVTVTGPGGVGKTRLVLRLARDLRRLFPDGVWMVELDALNASGMVAHAVADSLGVQEQPSGDPVASLAAQLEDRRLLLLLDNCEHVLDEASALASAVLQMCPEVRVLATSRQALGVAGEFIFNLAPFSVPRAEDLALPDLEVPGYDAVGLFTERARAVVPGFEITADNRQAVATLCARLEGIPLAIELASARLRALSLAEILERLDDRFRLLSAGARRAEPRQQTLQSVVDWSFHLCSAEEQRLWLRASVFAGGFDLPAAEAICTDDELPHGAVLDLVASLVDKSILSREDRGASARYVMLDTLREYGHTRLVASGEGRSMHRRHRQYFESVARERVFGRHAREVLDRLRAEHGNLRAALEFCASEPGQAVHGLALASALWHFWTANGTFAEARTWLARLLEVAPQEVTENHAWALCMAGWFASLQNDLAAAAALLERSRAEATQLHDRTLLGYVAMFSGSVATAEGRNADAMALFQKALDDLRLTTDVPGIAFSARRLAMTESAAGEHERAAAHYAECLRLCEEHGEDWEKAYALWGLGLVAWRQADHTRATELLRQSIRINSSFDDRRAVALGIEGLAWVAADTKQEEQAAVLLGAADAIWRIFEAPLAGFVQLADDHDQCEEAVRRALGEQAYEAAFQSGAQLTPQQAAEYAVDPESRDATSRRRPRPVESPSPLTRREQEIAQLVARGLTNREIASQLVISDRTAEAHVEHILTKLGFRSRTQIAAWLLQQQSPDSHDRRAAPDG